MYGGCLLCPLYPLLLQDVPGSWLVFDSNLMICRLEAGEAKFRRPDQGSHGCPRDSFISCGYSVSFFVLSFPVPASRDFAYVSFRSSSIPD